MCYTVLQTGQAQELLMEHGKHKPAMKKHMMKEMPPKSMPKPKRKGKK